MWRCSVYAYPCLNSDPNIYSASDADVYSLPFSYTDSNVGAYTQTISDSHSKPSEVVPN